jgi:sec-independent protein translocase protein TatA
MFKNIGAAELLIIFILFIVFFGGKKIAQLAKGAGETVGELKRAKKELEDSVQEIDKKK